MAHSERSPSSAHRWINCPGSVAMCRNIPEEGPSVYAAEGTAAHSLADLCLRIGEDPHDFKGEIGGFPITDEMKDAVGMYVDQVRAYGNEDKYGVCFLDVEQAIPLEHDEEYTGTVDALITQRDQRTVVVCDFKYGKGVLVEAVMNPQLMLYAIGCNLKNIDTIRLVIVQPRCPCPDIPIRFWDLSVEALYFWYEHMVEPTLKLDFLRAGEHCVFCPAKAICPKQKQLAEETALTEFADFGPPLVETLTVEEISKVLFHGKAIIKWINAVNEQAHSILERGGGIPDYKLVEKLGNRKWVDSALDIQNALYSLREEIYAPAKLKSPAQIEKIKGGKEILKEHPELITRDTTTAIVHVTDKRPAVQGTSAKDDFADV